VVVVHLPDDDEAAAGVVDRLEEDPEAFRHFHSFRNYPKMMADDWA
jgi:hypothetical protein